MEEVTLAADASRPTGSRPARRLRREGRVPAVLYGHGIDPLALAVDGRDLRHALTGEAGLNALITLQIDGDSHLAMARHLQRHPVRGAVTHVDFVVVRRDEVVTADVPVHLVGEAKAVLNEDGIVDQPLFSLSIQAKPLDIPGAIEVDVSALTIGDTIRVGDLQLPDGVATEVDPDEPVVTGQPPMAAEPTAEEVALAELADLPEEEREALVGLAEVAPGEGEAAAGGDGGGDASEGGGSAEG